MLTKAIIVEIVTKYQAKVRIPLYNKAQGTASATPDDSLPIATMCTLPGMYPNYQKGDVVWVGFEQNIFTQPVILGLLYRSNMGASTTDIIVNNITATSSATFPNVTNIGNVTADNIQTLTDVNGSIQEQLDTIRSSSGVYPSITDEEIDEITST